MKKRLAVVIDKELHQKAKYEAYKEGCTLTDKIVILLNTWLVTKEVKK